MKIRMFTSFVAASILGLSLTGCYSIRGTQGAPGLYSMNVRQEFTIGKTTKTQVTDELGTPTKTVPEKDGITTLVYDSYKFSGANALLFNLGRTEKHKLVRFFFDRKDILQKIQVRRFTQSVTLGHRSDDKNP